MFKKMKFYCFVAIYLLFLVTTICFVPLDEVFADNEKFEVTTQKQDNKTKYIIKNAFNYKTNETGTGLKTSQNNLLKNVLNFSDSFIETMAEEDINLYMNSSYMEVTREEYLYLEENNNIEIALASDLKTNRTEYKKLYVTNILTKISENANGNNRYVASILVEWKNPPINRFKDLMYIVCGNGSTIGGSQYSKCYMSYYQTIYVSGVGSIGPSLVKYENGDSSNKVVPYNTITNGESWRLDVPFTSSYNTSISSFNFFMQSEVLFSRSQSVASVYYGYFHQKIAGSIGVTVSSSGASIAFSPKYTMDPFTGNYYTLEYGEIV